jgi:hypothetical protein
MARALLEAFLAALIVLAFGCSNARKTDASATPCEKDCMNDSGGKAWCADYCKKHGTYGPAKK